MVRTPSLAPALSTTTEAPALTPVLMLSHQTMIRIFGTLMTLTALTLIKMVTSTAMASHASPNPTRELTVMDTVTTLTDKKALLQHKKVPHQDTKAAALLQDKKVAALFQDKKAAALFQDKKVAALLQDKKAAALLQDKKEAALSQNTMEAALAQDMKAAALLQDKKVVPLLQARREAALSQDMMAAAPLQDKEAQLLSTRIVALLQDTAVTTASVMRQFLTRRTVSKIRRTTTPTPTPDPNLMVALALALPSMEFQLS